MKKIVRVAASAFVMGAGLGLVGLGAADIAQAHPAPFAPMPDYHWCPGEFYDPAWGPNWDWNRCHDDGFYDGEPRDGGHWHGNGPYDEGYGRGPGGPGDPWRP
jgi:hypothetical protein